MNYVYMINGMAQSLALHSRIHRDLYKISGEDVRFFSPFFFLFLSFFFTFVVWHIIVVK